MAFIKTKPIETFYLSKYPIASFLTALYFNFGPNSAEIISKVMGPYSGVLLTPHIIATSRGLFHKT